MLQSLHVKNLVLIDEVEIEFKSGLNILTGETGAGKSIIIGSIHLALGGRFQGDILRKGAQSGFVELSFLIENEHQREQLLTLDVIPEDGLVVLNRKFMEGRSVSRVNGETVPVNRLKAIAEILIDIHGQHEHQSLLKKHNHLMILDEFGKSEIGPLKADFEHHYAQFQELGKRLKDNSLDESARQRELSLLRFEMEEIDAAKLHEGEDEELEEQYRKMNNGKKISTGIGEVYGLTGDSAGQSASESLSRALRTMQEIADYDEQVAELAGQLSEIDQLLNDFNHELSNYGADLEFSESDFYEIENRLNLINHLKAKYGTTIGEIVTYYQEQETRLNELVNYESYLQDLQEEYETAAAQTKAAAKKLSQARDTGAKELTERIAQGLSELNFPQVEFTTMMSRLSEYNRFGQDEAEFLISLNPGEAMKPLKAVASGGELSRIMLVIKTVLADKEDTETLIFDEIDVGISGRTAQKVSEKMALLGESRQVICITHLAQIAAMADAHYLIEKKVAKERSETTISLLDEEDSIRELARILGGAEITDLVLKNAAEMKRLAKSSR